MRQLLKNGSELLFRRHSSILSAAMIIMFTYGISLVIGFLKNRLLLSYFFAFHSDALDAYKAAFVIPDTLFQILVVGSLSASFIPIYNRFAARSESEANTMAASTINLLLLAFAAIAIFIIIFALPLSRLVAPGFSPQKIAIMVPLLQVMMSAQIFFCLSGFLTSVIQSHQRFLVPALAPIVYNLSIILGIILLAPSLGIMGAAVGVVIGSFFHMLIQLPLALKLGFRFRAIFQPRNPGVLEVCRLMPPRALALGIDQIEQFVAVTLASYLASGSLALFHVSYTLYTLPSTLFGLTMGQAALPQMSKDAALPTLTTYWSTVSSSILQIAFLALPVSTLLIVLRIPVVRLVYGVPTLPWSATWLTGQTMAILILSASFASIMQLVIRAFYALHDTTTPLAVGLAAALFNIISGTLAVHVWHLGVMGIASAITATSILETSMLFVLLQRRAPVATTLALLQSLGKMLFISLVTGLGLWLPMHFLDQFVFDTTRTLPLLALTLTTSLIGFSVYLFLSYLFKIDQLNSVFQLLKRLTTLHTFFQAHKVEPLIITTPEQE